MRGRWAARAFGLAGLAPFDRLHALQAERGVSPCGVSPPLPHLPATYGRECNDHPLSEQVALLIKTFPPQGFSAEWHWLQARAAEDSRIVLIAESLPREELLALYGCCDVFLSLHRSEGFRRGMVEALQLTGRAWASGCAGWRIGVRWGCERGAVIARIHRGWYWRTIK